MSVPASEQDEQTRALTPPRVASPQRAQQTDVTAINTALGAYSVLTPQNQQGRIQQLNEIKAILTRLRRDGARILLRDDRVRVPLTGLPPLLWAMKPSNDYDLFNLLLDYGADADVTDPRSDSSSHNYPALLVAVIYPENHTFAEILVKRGANVNGTLAFNGDDVTILQFAMQRFARTQQEQVPRPDDDIMTDLKNAELLITHGADITVRDKVGQTLLMLAMMYSPPVQMDMDNMHVTVVRLLLKGKGTRMVNVKNTRGDTALVYALLTQQRAHVLDILMTHGADPSITNNGNRNAFDLAKDINDLMVVYLHASRANWTMKQRLVKSAITLVVFIVSFTFALMAYVFPKRFPRWSLILNCVVAVVAFVLYGVMQVTTWQTLSASE